jgi:hypothetical protein
MLGSVIKHRIAWPCSLALTALAQTASAQPEATLHAISQPLSLPAVYSAAPRAAVVAAPRMHSQSWYGWQLLIGYGVTDLFVVSGVLAGIADGNWDGIPLPMIMLTGTGLASQVFTSPIIHWAHGNVGRGFISFGLNGALPVMGAGLGFAAGGGDSGASFTGFMVGVTLGVLGGRAIDVALVAFDYDELVSAAASDTPEWVSSLKLVPIAGPDRAGAGIAGIF